MCLINKIMKSKRIENTFLVLNWLFGIFFLIAGIGAFENSSSNDVILCCIISCLLLPPIRKYIYTITKINISAGSRGLIIFLLLNFIESPEKESPFDTYIETNQVDESN
jgi:hypothetical protein